MSLLLHRLKQLLIVLILVWGALAMLARFATPLLEHARQPLTDWLSRQLGAPVRIGQLKASWYGITPRLRLQQVAVGEGEQPVRLARVDVDLAPSGLFRGNPLDALRLTVHGLQIHLQRLKDGRIEVHGLTLVENGKDSLPTGLPYRLRLLDTRLVWQDLRAGGKQLQLDDVDLETYLDGSRLQVRAALSSPLGSARFAADLDWPLHPDDWSGQSFLQVDGLALEPLLGVYLPTHYKIGGGRLQAQVWQSWEHARALLSQGELHVRNLRLSDNAPVPHQVDLQHLGGEFRFQREADKDWRLDIAKLHIQSPGQPPWPGSQVVVALRPNGGGKAELHVAATRLRLGILAKLLLLRNPVPELTPALSTLRPHALLHNLRLRAALHSADDWAVSSDIEQLGWQPWQQVPGVQGLSGHLAAQPKHASLQLDTHQATLLADRLFRDTLHLTQLQGTLHWQRHEHGWRLLSERLAVKTPDFRSTSRLRLQVAEDRPTQLDLITSLLDARVAATPRYLPAHIMGKQLVHWLDGSLSDGHLEQATLLVSGPLRDFPFERRRSGAFEVVAVTRDTPLDYQPGWPPLRDVDARLHFHENSLDIDLLKGRIYHSRIDSAHARIASLVPTSPLSMRGKVSGPLADPIQLLGEPALKNFNHIAKALKVDGNSQLALNFQVPLVHGRGRYQLDGELRFLGDSMRLPEWDLALDHIEGALQIGLDEIRAKAIQARGLGSELRVDVGPQSDGSTLVSARGTLSADAIAKRLPQVPLQHVQGQAPFRVELDIPGVSAAADTPTLLRVHSELDGMRIELPEPLGKSAAQRVPLQVSLGVAGRSQPLRLDYGKLSAVFSNDGARGEIRYARGQPQLPQRAGYRVLADLPTLDLAAWQTVASSLGNGEPPGGWSASIRADELRFGQLALPKVTLDLSADSKALSGKVSGPKLRGQFRYPHDRRQPLTIELAKAELPLPSAHGATGTPAKTNAPDPRQLPPVQMQIDAFTLNRADLGQVYLSSERTFDGLRLSELRVDGPSGKLHATGDWTRHGTLSRSTLQGILKTPALGDLLEQLDFPRSVHEAPADAQFDLSWPGDPLQFGAATLAGKAHLHLGEGRLAQLEPGITRVLGLLSIDALGRRLKLDFGDVTKKGYSFDKLQGDFRFRDGNAYTNNLRVEGPSGRIEFGGRIGLVDHDFDALVNVTPELDATLPLASTLAGGPVAGIAALLAQQLMSDKVDQIYRFEYSVGGTWDEPKLTPLDSGGALSRIVNTVTGKKTESKSKAQQELIKAEPPRKNILERLLDALPGKKSGSPSEAESAQPPTSSTPFAP